MMEQLTDRLKEGITIGGRKIRNIRFLRTIHGVDICHQRQKEMCELLSTIDGISKEADLERSIHNPR